MRMQQCARGAQPSLTCWKKTTWSRSSPKKACSSKCALVAASVLPLVIRYSRSGCLQVGRKPFDGSCLLDGSTAA